MQHALPSLRMRLPADASSTFLVPCPVALALLWPLPHLPSIPQMRNIAGRASCEPRHVEPARYSRALHPQWPVSSAHTLTPFRASRCSGHILIAHSDKAALLWPLQHLSFGSQMQSTCGRASYKLGLGENASNGRANYKEE